MKIFDFFYSEKVNFHQNKKNFIITQQGEGLATLTNMDDNNRVWGGVAPSARLFFFLILKPVSFKKLNGTRWGDKKILKPIPFTFDFCFYFFYIFLFIFIILKLIYLIKN